MMKIDSISRPMPLQIPTLSSQIVPLSGSQTPPSRTSFTDGLIPSDDSSASPPSPPPPPPPIASVVNQPAAPSPYVKYSTLARLQSQGQARSQPPGAASLTLPIQSTTPNYNTLPAAYSASPPLPPSPPPPPPPSAPAPGSAMAVLKFGLPSPSALPPPPPLEEEAQDASYLPPPPPESLEANGLPPPPELDTDSCSHFHNSGLQHFLSQKFPNMVYDFSPPVLDENSPRPPSIELSPPSSLQILRPLSPNAPPPAPPKTFTGGFPPQTAPKPSGPSSLPIALSPVSPTPPHSFHGPMKKQQSFSTGHSPNQPPPTLPKQHSLSSKSLALSPSSSSSSVSIAAATSSLVKQIVNQFPGNASPSSLSASSSMEGSKFSAPPSPPAVKAKPKWQPGGVTAPQSPEFPPPPPDSSMGDFPPPPSASSSKTGSPIKKSPSTSSTGSNKRGPPPAPQRASSIRANSGEVQDERPKKVESLVNKFGQAPQTGTSSSSSSATGSPSRDSSALPAALPKPGKLNLANLPLALQGLQTGQHHQPTDFPSPPPPPPPSQPQHLESSPDYFPPPPSDSELFPPPPHPSEFHHPPKVAVVNPQPQKQPPQQPATSSLSSSSWKQGSLKKGAVPPPSVNRRSSNPPQFDSTISLPLSPPPLSQTPPPSLSSYSSSSSSPVPPTSPKSPGPSTLTLKTHFLEDLNRTLKRKSVSRHGSLTSSHLIPSSKMEPMATMDDMALLPPPPPELMQQQQANRGHSQTLSRYHTHSHSTKHANISGYATLRRGPPPAPPKRDQSTKLTSEW